MSGSVNKYPRWLQTCPRLTTILVKCLCSQGWYLIWVARLLMRKTCTPMSSFTTNKLGKPSKYGILNSKEGYKTYTIYFWEQRFCSRRFWYCDLGQHESYLLSSVPKQKGKLLQDEISEHIELLQNYRKQYICYWIKLLNS